MKLRERSFPTHRVLYLSEVAQHKQLYSHASLSNHTSTYGEIDGQIDETRQTARH